MLRILISALALVCLLASCGGNRPAGQNTPRMPALARGYVGAQTLPLRKQLSVHSEVVATAKFGDRVSILRRVRMSMFIRNEADQEGWVDGRMLIREQEMQMLQQIRQDYRDTPSMGAAKPYDVLNVHTSPSRGSPSLEQLQDTQTVEVLGHRVAMRAPYQPTTLPPPNKGKKKRNGKRDDAVNIEEPPPPPAPPLPDGWRELSQVQGAEPEEEPRKKGRRGSVKNALLLKAEQDRKKPVGPTYDDWSLVRTPSGQVGWALSSALVMSLPDDVLQYAQRQRITAYFQLGEVVDAEKGTKGTYLWTTSSKRGQPYQFDAVRLFVFNTKRHRYETAFQLKDQIGYFPVEVTGVKEGRPQIAFILEDAKGDCVRRRYTFENGRMKELDTVSVPKPRQPQAAEDLPMMSIPESPAEETPSWWSQAMKTLFGK